MKKTIAALLALTIILTFTACGSKENMHSDTSGVVSDNQTISNTQNGNETISNNLSGSGDVSSETDSSDSGDNSATTSNPSDAKNPENATNSTNSGKPTDSNTPTDVSKPSGNNTNPHTHSFSAATCTEAKKCSCGATEGKALGHKWDEATCKVPKTCSFCKKTEGNKVNHIVSGTTCKWCKQVVPVSPTLLKNREYIFYKLIDYPFENEIEFAGTLALYNASVNFTKNQYGGEMRHEGVLSPDYPAEAPPPINYNNKYYFPNTGNACPIQKSISDNRVIVTLADHSEQRKIEFELLSNDTLRIVSMTNIPKDDPCFFNFSIGDIFV